MANIGTAYFRVAPDMSGVQGKISRGLQGSGTTFAKGFGKEVSGRSAAIIGAVAGAAQAATQKAMSLISDSIGSAIRRVDTLNAAQKTFEYMGFRASDAAKATKNLTDSILGLPTPLDAAVRGMTSLAATYGDVNLGQKVFSALNNAILGFGGSAEMVDNAIQQISQLPLDGPLDAQTWMSLRNSGLTPVLVAMGKDMGKSVSKLKEEFGEGELKVQDFVNQLVKMNKEGGGGLVALEKIAQNATSGISTGFANMQTAVARGIANIIQSIGAANISKAITAIGNAFEKTLTTISKVLADSDVQIAILIAAIGGLAFAFYSLAPAVWAALAPILPFVAGFAALVGIVKLVRANWDKIAPIVDRAKDAFSKFWDVIKPVRDFMAQQLKSAIESIVSIGKQLWQSLQPIVTAFKQILANQKVQTVLKVIGIALAALVAAPVVAFFAGIVAAITVLSKILGFVATHFDTIKKVVVTVLKVAIAPFVVGILLVVGTVKALIAIFRWVVSAIKTVVGAIISVVKAVNTFLAPVIKFMQDLFVVVFGGILLVVIYTVKAILSVVIRIFRAVYNFVKSILSAIWGVISAVWNRIYGFVKTVLTRLFNFYSMIFGKIFSVIRTIVQRIFNFFAPAVNWLYSKGRAIIQGLVNGIRGMASRVWSAISSVSSRIGRFFAGAGRWLWDTGRAIVQGLANGIKSAVGAVTGAVSDAANSIKSKFANILGIRSPSRVFAAYGVNIAEGLAKGIKGSKGMVSGTVNDLANSTLNGVTNPAFSVGTFRGNASLGAGNATNTNQTVSIQTVVLGDSSAVREFFKQLNQDTINVGMGLTPIQGAK